jgi:hypothetical protein
MNASRAKIFRLAALAFAGTVANASGQSPDPLAAAAIAPAVELPPMVVAESATVPPWLYVKVGGMEYLSRCSAATTRSYAEEWERALQLMGAFVPDSLLPRSEIPALTILVSQKLGQSTSPELLRELKQQAALHDRTSFGQPPRVITYSFAPNMRLEDRDTYATFAYIDEASFDASRLTATPAYLRFLLERRVPALPAWFIEGIEQAYRSATLSLKEITLPDFLWIDETQTRRLSRDADAPRALLPANELFAPDALRGPVNGNAQRIETMKAQVALFVRWALENGPATREALWQLAARAAEQPVTEPMFESCFGFGFAELRDRLSDYLPGTVRQFPRLDPGKLPRVPRPAVREATVNEIARLRGEWERLAIGFVKNGQPEVQGRYVAQAQRTLHRAYDTGDRDPRLLATLGLCELAEGDTRAALNFLESATAARVVRPRAYYELARLRLADLLRDQPPTKLFSLAELRPVLDLLRAGAQQKPLLPETFLLLGDALVRSNTAPSTEHLTLLDVGARAFASRPDVSFQIALAFARHGRREAAGALLAKSSNYVTDDLMSTRFAQLSETLKLDARAKPENSKD